MKLSNLQKYKHDTLGKFQTLKELIEDLDEESLKSEEALEIIEAAHESYQNMYLASSEFIKKLQASKSV